MKKKMNKKKNIFFYTNQLNNLIKIQYFHRSIF
jgi:hypothetical protein